MRVYAGKSVRDGDGGGGGALSLQSASLLLPESLIPHRLPATDGRTDGHTEPRRAAVRRQQRQQRRLWRRSILRGGSRRDAAEAEESVLIFSLHSLLLRHISSPRSRRRIATFSCFVFFLLLSCPLIRARPSCLLRLVSLFPPRRCSV